MQNVLEMCNVQCKIYMQCAMFFMQYAMCNVLEMFTNLTKLDETLFRWTKHYSVGRNAIPLDETLFRRTKRYSVGRNTYP